MDYSKTVNLLQTAFPMKADLPVREPQFLEKWNTMELVQKMNERGKKQKLFLLHDGPPYANGVIHMGHALNKILKDIVVKYKRLQGFHAPYKPGWDCHGLPIEHQLFKEWGKSKHEVTRLELREKAAAFAMNFVNKQRDDFKRLGILGDWENPYLTLSNEYEAATVDVFFQLRDRRFINQGLKPGYWCAYDETALAEAEVEYADKKSDAVFVRFKLNSKTVPVKLPSAEPHVLIWTTTPWTLPANVGLAFHPTEYYIVLKTAKGDLIVAEKLAETIAKKVGGGDKLAGRWQGKDFVGAEASNPLHGGLSRVVTAGYVTMEDGTGVVHIAPGHGVEDFAVGQKFNLETVCPVDSRGRYDDTVGRADLVGKHVLKDANAAVIEALGSNLLHHEQFTHSYPHCWRCKNPIIFRATKQWFLMVSDDFRKKLLGEIDKVKWEPDYGIHRIKGMVEQRPDWCLSRQRHWGAPIAVYLCTACKEPLHNKDLDKKTVDFIRTQGASAWYAANVDDLLKGIPAKCVKCGGAKFEKEMDILDVWFDSGVSWYAVVQQNFSNPKPETVMYLEGSDQHRGWFQTSLIPATAINNKAPYDIVLTHGFVVDGKGHKMSKSTGNVISPQDIIKQYGADVLRLWVGSSDYREDVRLSQDIVKQSVEMYRKFRNTFRFLLQNTADFKLTENGMPVEKMEEIDRWILVHFEELKKNVLKAYEDCQFHVVLAELNRFVSVALSGFYLDAHKDRLYCEAVNSPKRRSAQTALYHLNRGLAVLLSPVLSFTSEEAYLELRNVSNPELLESVFLEEAANLVAVSFDEKLNAKWLGVLNVRGQVNDVLDQERKAGKLKTSQEAAVHINADKLTAESRAVISEISDWPFLLQMAEVHVNGKNETDSAVRIEPTKNAKCERCWRYRPDVGAEAKHPTLCKRCADVVA